MKKNLQVVLSIVIASIGIDTNAQTRYLDDIFSGVTVTSDVVYANNISILPMLFGLPPANNFGSYFTFNPIAKKALQN